jgi:hypothetical protein
MNAQPVDHDLLARYVGGALDGTPDETDVAALVATDPAWGRAHDELLAALDALSADLAAYAAVDGAPMPDDVAARLDAAVAKPPLTVVPGGRHTAPRRRRRLPAWTAPVAIAAGVAALAGFWINGSGVTTGADDTGGESAAGSAADNAGPAPMAAPVPPDRQVSGVNYDRQAVARGAPVLTAPEDQHHRSSGGDTDGKPFASEAPGAALQPVPAGLGRLTDPTELARCLEAISAAHRVPIQQTAAVDFARFEGSPALIVFFVDADGQRWAWVAGPDCSTAGPDTRYSTRVA